MEITCTYLLDNTRKLEAPLGGIGLHWAIMSSNCQILLGNFGLHWLIICTLVYYMCLFAKIRLNWP